MTEQRTALELLCPARDLECGFAAIDHGADAVYVGAPQFGARAAAGNSVADIAALVRYAHKYRARVYVTLNTILYDHELEEARSLVLQVYEAGADALIIQDMGLLELDLPPIPLFASTQTHNYEVDTIHFLEQVGIQRVILARELSLKQIREIRNATTVDLEFFVHGALCVSFSGQCYFSQAVAGRSANRGECGQMCRLPYSLIDGRGNVLASNQHLLSLKDLNLSAYIADLVEAGITSFKIEGRLKEPSYVKNITAFYRAKLDAYIEGHRDYGRASSGTTTFFFTPSPEKTFSRGTTDYFIRGRKEKVVSLRTPKSLGEFLGNVKTVGDGFFTLDTTEPLHNGDGVCFFNDDDELSGVNVNEVTGGRVFPNSMEGIRPGAVIYRNYDHEFVQLLKTGSSDRRIGVRLIFGESEDGFRLHAMDEDGNEVEQRLVFEKQIARKADAALETIKRQLLKLGETVYHAEGLNLDLKQAYFLPVGMLNELRRECTGALDAKRAAGFARQESVIAPNDVPYPISTLDYRANVTNAKARRFYERHGVKHIEDGFELQSDASGKALMTTRHCLKYQFDMCRGEKGNAEELFLSDGKTKYKLEFDCDACVMKIVSP